jgi:signal transduction histidine kinase
LWRSFPNDFLRPEMKRRIPYISLAFTVSLLVIVSISILFYRNLHASRVYTDKMANAYEVLNKIQTVQYLLLHAENSQRGYLINRDTSFLNEIANASTRISVEAESLEKLLQGTTPQEEIVVKLKATISERFVALSHRTQAYARGDKEAFKESFLRGKKIMEDFNRYASQMKAEEFEDLENENNKRKKFENAGPAYLAAIFSVCLVFLVVSFISIIREFRQRYRYQKELEQKINELNMSHAELEQLAFIASHDLQEPLRKIRTFSGQLQLQWGDKLDDKGRSLISKIEAAAKRMHGLIQDIVEYTNLVNSEEKLQKVDLKECIEEAQLKLANSIAKHNVTINTKNLKTIDGYRFQLQLLFTNLIHNSIKFSREGEAPVINITGEKILATTHLNPFNHPLENEPYLVVKVEDSGIGFNNESAAKIFVIFQRLHHESSKYTGKGIGLSICKRVMTNHKGFISAKGEPGVGATFYLYFPL